MSLGSSVTESHLIQLIASANHLIDTAEGIIKRNESDWLVKAAENELAFAMREKEKYEKRLSLIRP